LRNGLIVFLRLFFVQSDSNTNLHPACKVRETRLFRKKNTNRFEVPVWRLFGSLLIFVTSSKLDKMKF